MHLIVPVDRPTAAEAVAVCRSLTETGVGFAMGTRLLMRGGGSVATALAAFGTVFADARLSGGASDVVGAARHLAASGASRVSVDGRVGPTTLGAVIDAVRPHGTRIVVMTIPPEADDASTELSTGRTGRGRVVSLMAASVAGLDVDILATGADIGVVAQVSRALGLVVTGLRNTNDVGDAAQRGAIAGVLDSSVIDAPNPLPGLLELIEAARID